MTKKLFFQFSKLLTFILLWGCPIDHGHSNEDIDRAAVEAAIKSIRTLRQDVQVVMMFDDSTKRSKNPKASSIKVKDAEFNIFSMSPEGLKILWHHITDLKDVLGSQYPDDDRESHLSIIYKEIPELEKIISRPNIESNKHTLLEEIVIKEADKSGPEVKKKPLDRLPPHSLKEKLSLMAASFDAQLNTALGVVEQAEDYLKKKAEQESAFSVFDTYTGQVDSSSSSSSSSSSGSSTHHDEIEKEEEHESDGEKAKDIEGEKAKDTEGDTTE